MKRVYMILISALLVVPMTACGDDNGTVGSDLSEETVPPDEGDSGNDSPAETTDILLTVGDTSIRATLANNRTTTEFLATLPRMITMNRYDNREYYGRIGTLSEEGEQIDNYTNGDVTYYPAGPSFAIFFAKDGESRQSGLIRMGRITSDLSVFNGLGAQIEMRIEVVRE